MRQEFGNGGIMMRKGIAVSLGLCALGALGSVASAQDFLGEAYGFSVIEDVVYGTGAVNSPAPGNMNLLADIYVPTGPDLPRDRPALIVVHGGFWAFGTKDAIENTDFIDPGRFFDTEGVYAREFAKRGYVCMSIDYRMLGDQPPGTGLFAGIGGSSTTDFVSTIQAFGSGAATAPECIAAVEAAVADTQRAVQYLRANANLYSVDTNRIALGGWSAGASNAILAAYAGGADVRAVWCSSGGTGGNDFLITPGGPGTILFHGDSDGNIPVTQSQTLNAALDLAGLSNAYYEIPSEDHYFVRGTIVNGPPAKGGLSVEDTLAEFLHAEMELQDLQDDNATPIPVADTLGMSALTAVLGAAGLLILRRRPMVPVRSINR
jgi:acetyl esterase/lipase